MVSAELSQSWSVTLRHLAACRFYLPERLDGDAAQNAERELISYLHHNELGLALCEAEALGDACNAPPQFWRELQLAAENMGKTEAASRYASRNEI
jgi:hypothetical protein